MRNWTGLIPEMLSLICKKVDTFKELVAFGGVCSTWRHEAVRQNLGQPLLPLLWLMLAENQNDDFREFYSLTEGKTYNFKLPELRGKKCMETKGWIVTASNEGEMALIHPLTRVQISLPHQNTSEIYKEHRMDPLVFVERAVISSPPDTKNASDCVVAILHGDLGHVGFCRLGDEIWTVVENHFESGIAALEYFRGKFYVVNNGGHVWEYDVIGKSSCGVITQRRIGENFLEYISSRQLYLVEFAGSLLLISRNGVDVDAYGTTEFWVIEIDVELNGYEKVTTLGTRAIFLGHSATLFIDTKWYPELVPNSIYFTDDCIEAYLYGRVEPEGGGKNMGVYNLEDKSVQPHYSGKSLSFVCPPVWTFLTTR